MGSATGIVDKHGLTYQGCKSFFQVLFKMFLAQRSEWFVDLFLCPLFSIVLCVQAVVQEQGLMNDYKRLRRSAIQTTEDSKQKQHHQSESSNPPTPESKHTVTLNSLMLFPP